MISYAPKIRSELGATAEDAGTLTTLSGTQSSTYLQTTKPGVVHFGLKGWLAIPSAAATAHVYQLNILRTQIRRYKINK